MLLRPHRPGQPVRPWLRRGPGGEEPLLTARDNVSLLRSWRTLAIAAIVLAGIGGVWLIGDHTPVNLGRVTLAVGGAGLVAWFSTRRPAVAFGILFLLASLSRWTIETKLGSMRMEQPSIAIGFLAILYARRLPDLATLRRLLPMGVAFVVYLGALTASSVLHAPDRADSLRMTFWIGLSIVGGLLAFLLLVGEDHSRAPRWLRFAGAGQASVGIAVAIIFFTLGPVIVAGTDPMPGMQDALSVWPKVFAMSWEANLYASLLGALSVFAIEEFRSSPRPRSAAVVAVVLLGLAVGVTRGAYIGFAAGLITYGAVILLRTHRPRSLLVPASVVIGAIVVGALVAPVVLPAGRDLNKPINVTTPGWGRGLTIGPFVLPGLGPQAVGTGGSPGGAASATPAPGGHVVLPPAPDTIAFRLDRIPVALKDLAHDPILGLGANSFGQRHADPSQGGAPDHIGILALAALYESGLVGSLGLLIGFALILFALWRASRHPDSGPMAAAYLGSLACLLVSYQATNAINFSLIWLISGAGLALAFSERVDSRVEPDLSIRSGSPSIGELSTS